MQSMRTKKTKIEKPVTPVEPTEEGVTVVKTMSEAQREIMEPDMSDEPKLVKIEKKDEQLPTTVKKAEKKDAYTFMRNVKFQGRYYKAGDTIEAEGNDLQFLIKNSLIK